MTKGEEITKQAFDEFAAWCQVHDPDGEFGILENVERYIASRRGEDLTPKETS